LIHQNLKFDLSWDQKSGYKTKQVLAVPVVFDQKLLGVLQLINKKDGGAFTKVDEKTGIEIARVLGIAFHNQSRMVHTRFDYLISQNIIAENELKQAVASAREKKKDIETVLMEDFKVKKSDLGTSLSQFYGCKFVEYSTSVFIQRELLKGLNLAYLKKSGWIPVSVVDGKAVVLMANPNDRQKTTEIKGLLRAKEYQFQVALRDDILKFFEAPETEVQESKASVSDILEEMEVGEEISEEDLAEDALEEASSTIVRLVNQVIIDGYMKGASDIHVEPSKAKKLTFVRYRVDGVCFKHLEIPYSYSRAISSRIKIMATLDIAERRLPQDGKIKFIYKDKQIELRVATLPTVGGEDVVMRILSASEPMPLDALNLAPANSNNLKQIISKPYGIVLVVGPTGSGKTTTLHAALGFINTPDRKIWTAEDPVEITQEGLRQVEVKPKIDFNFARAMRAFLRADPDVIMIGEMRDHETAAIGIEASLTGHLVFSTLHTNSAPETITRLIDMDIDPFNFADALLGVLAQRLVRTLCKHCKEAYNPSQEEFDELAKAYGPSFPELGLQYGPKLALCRPKGCDECNHTGYKGRTGLHELLMGTDETKTLIQQKSLMEAIRDQAIRDGRQLGMA
jgi:type II secretory ATPase GspE/PulE/Tfp pilus assembly ATPase PilB-like protein